jgi:hypothetical protein
MKLDVHWAPWVNVITPGWIGFAALCVADAGAATAAQTAIAITTTKA